MSKGKKVRDQLKRVILQHCTCLTEDERDREMEGYIDYILFMYENSLEAANVSEDLIRFEELESHLKEAARLLLELSQASKRKLSFRIEKQWISIHSGSNYRSQLESGDVLCQRYVSLNTLLDGVEKVRQLAVKDDQDIKLLNAEVSAKPASIKRNYKAAVVAVACMKPWYRHGVVKYGEEYEIPNSIHATRINQPMGDFIQDVFDVLKIGAQASSALKAVEDLGGRYRIMVLDEVS